MTTITDVTTQPSSGLTHIDALLDAGPGWNWLAPERKTLYYTFALNGINSSDIGSVLASAPTAFNSTQQAAVASALATVTQITGIQFALTSDGTAADLHFGNGDLISVHATGTCSTEWNYNYSGNTIVRYTADAYIYLDIANYGSTNLLPTAGSEGYEVLLHEIGHALGLKHPFSGGVTLPSSQDNTANTLMSYTHVGGPYTTYSPTDIAALMWLYGGDGLGGALGQGTGGLYLVGTGSADVMSGGAGNDMLEGKAGADTLTGGAGTDTARYSGSLAAYTVTATAGGYTVSGSEGTDTLIGIEKLQFADTLLTLSGQSQNNPPTGGLALSGTAQQKSTLSVISTLADADGLGTLSYRWQTSPDGGAWTDLSGATSSSLPLDETHVGLQIRVIGSFVDGHGTTESATSAGTTAVGNVNDAPTGTVTVAGTAASGQILVSVIALADPDGLGVLSYQWQSSANGSTWSDLAGATASSLTLTKAQVGTQLRVIASYIDGHGTTESVASAGTPTVVNLNDPPTGSVTISGTARQGQTLRSANTLADGDGLGTISHQWQTSSNGSSWLNLPNATASSLDLTEAQVGLRVRVVDSYIDGRGTTESIASASTAAVANVNDTPGGSLLISGTVTQGETLRGASTLTDADGMGSIAYQWQSSTNGLAWANVASASGSSLLLGTPQVGHLLRLQARWVDQHGTTETVLSNVTAAVLGSQTGGAGSDTLVGTIYADALSGLDGNDRLNGGGGHDRLDGGAGLDTALFAQLRSAYAIQANQDGTISVQSLSGEEGTDTLSHVERLGFADGSLAFDLTGGAGTVARFLGAVFGKDSVKDPHIVGIGLSYIDAGMSPAALMALALEARLTPGYSPEAEVTLLYQNLVGVAPSSEDLNYWTGTLASGQYSAVGLALMAADLDLNLVNIDFVGLAQTGLAFN